MQWKYPNPLLSENPPMGNLVPLPSWQRGLITTVIRTSGEDFGHHRIGTCRLVIVLTAVWLQVKTFCEVVKSRDTTAANMCHKPAFTLI